MGPAFQRPSCSVLWEGWGRDGTWAATPPHAVRCPGHGFFSLHGTLGGRSACPQATGT